MIGRMRIDDDSAKSRCGQRGTCFCPRCRTTVPANVFFDSETNCKVGALEQGFTKYVIRTESPKNLHITKEEQERIKKANGYPDIITVSEDEKIKKLSRRCPSCYEQSDENGNGIITPFTHEYGAYPYYVIGMIGRTQSGKSKWSGAIQACNYRSFNKSGCYSHTIESHPFIPGTEEMDYGEKVATLNQETAITRVIDIKKDGKTEKQLILVDSKGEDKRQEKDVPFDAKVVIINGQNAVSDHGEEISDISECFPTGSELAAYVVTHLKPLMSNKNLGISLQAFPQNAEKQAYDKRFSESITMQQEYVERISAVIASVTEDNSKMAHAFLVNSCSDVEDDLTKIRYIGEGINVLDPLLWLMLKLGALDVISQNKGE